MARRLPQGSRGWVSSAGTESPGCLLCPAASKPLSSPEAQAPSRGQIPASPVKEITFPRQPDPRSGRRGLGTAALSPPGPRRGWGGACDTQVSALVRGICLLICRLGLWGVIICCKTSNSFWN